MPPKKSDKKAVKGKDQTAAKPKKTDSNSAPDEKSLKHKTEDRPKSKTGKSKQELEVTGQQMNATKQSKKNSKLQIVQLPSYNSNQIKCIVKCGFFESIIPPGISVIIDRDIVELQGQDLKLLSVTKDEIEKCWTDMTHTCTTISIIPYQADLLTQPKVVEFINGYLDIENSSVTWDIVKVFDQGTLVVYAFDKKDAEDMQIRILSCIVEVCVKMKDTKLEWFQTLLKTKERRIIFTSNRYGDIIVYTTLDIFKKYFEGQTLSKSIKQPSNSDETKADNLTNSLGKVANWSGPPAHQSAATNLLTNLEQCSGGINPMKERQLDKKGEQDIQAPGTKEKKKEYSDSVSVSEQQVEYIAPDGKSLKHKTEDRPKSETGKSKQALEVTEQQMNATKKIVQLPSYNSNQINCIAKCGFFESIVPPGISVIIDRDIVELQGQDLKLLSVAKDEIEKCWKDMTHTCTTISIFPYQADLLTQPKVVEFINGYLDIENSSVTWDIVKVFDQGTLVVYAFDKKDAEDMQIRILSCIVEVCVKMKDTKLEWFQTLLKTKERRIIFTSNRYGDIIVYTTLDIFKKYFEGQTLSKSIKQPSNSDETKADNLTNSLGKVANWSGPPAHQSAATNLLTNLEQCPGGINPMKERQLDKKGEQDIQAPGTKEKKKEYSDSVSVSEQQVEYIGEFLSEKLLNICKKGIDWDLIDSKIVLRGKEKHVISAKKEVVALLDSISCLSRQTYCGKPSVPGEFTQKWKHMGKEKKIWIKTAKTEKPGVESGWVIATEKPKMHILYLKGPVHLADVDAVLCPVTDQLMPVYYMEGEH